ncbi:hypothetical protein MVEN_01056500 [Mycena venus]|uniref:Uncharacterized protein n=1 Tax=Mycena venus TaxID=2733690 RepID=A0A8H6Y786_9AGAR|nr:hypothetical protein MVEN_01056500 [Mycena venus]
MGRWTQYDEDAYRLPEGMVRTGYDADTGCYTFKERGGGTYTGLPGSQYGPMYPLGTDVGPKRIRVVTEPNWSGEEPKARRLTLPSVDVSGAFRSLRRSLTAVRRRRDESPGSDDEEPVMVERPLSPLLSADSTTLNDGSTAADRSLKLSRAMSSKTASATETRSSTSRDPPPPPPKDRLASKAPAESSNSSTPHTKLQSFISAHSRSASTSTPRSASPKGHTRRAASEHVHSPSPAAPSPPHRSALYDHKRPYRLPI